MSRLLTPEDLYALKLCGDPRISPDGTRIAYVHSEIDREAYEYRRSIWVTPTAGGAPRQFTSGPKDSAPRWSPDGSRLAFVRAPGGEVKPSSAEEHAKGKGKPQIWLMPADGGEPHHLRLRPLARALELSGGPGLGAGRSGWGAAAHLGRDAGRERSTILTGRSHAGVSGVAAPAWHRPHRSVYRASHPHRRDGATANRRLRADLRRYVHR